MRKLVLSHPIRDRSPGWRGYHDAERHRSTGAKAAGAAQYPTFFTGELPGGTSLGNAKDPVVNEGKVWFTLPDKIRREIGGKTPSTTVTDGKKVSIYYPNYQQVEVYDLEKRPIIKDTMRALTAGLNFREVATYYAIEGSKNGNEYQLTLTPKTAAVRKLVKTVDLTIDENLTPKRVVIHDSKDQVFTETYTNVRRDTLPASTFEFSPPPGTKVSTPLGN